MLCFTQKDMIMFNWRRPSKLLYQATTGYLSCTLVTRGGTVVHLAEQLRLMVLAGMGNYAEGFLGAELITVPKENGWGTDQFH